MESKIKYRMYFFVPYNISDIQKGIQCGHAVEKYVNEYGKKEDYKDYFRYSKTWIILNGGTTNSNDLDNPGTLNQIWRDRYHFNEVYHNERIQIDMSYFNEPDLNDALTSLCFLADERVWDYETYPDFYDWFQEVKITPGAKAEMDRRNPQIRRFTSEKHKELFPEYYEQWVKEVLGGIKNEYLRNLIRNKKLA